MEQNRIAQEIIALLELRNLSDSEAQEVLSILGRFYSSEQGESNKRLEGANV